MTSVDEQSVYVATTRTTIKSPSTPSTITNYCVISVCPDSRHIHAVGYNDVVRATQNVYMSDYYNRLISKTEHQFNSSV